MRNRYTNCRKRQIGGHTYWIARLVFPRDPLTHVRPKPKEFTGKTAAEADGKRAAYFAEYKRNPQADRETCFGQYLQTEFIPYVESLYNAGELSWGRYQERASRLKRFLLNHEAGQQLAKVTLGNLTPEVVERYFDRLLAAGLSGNRRNMVRQDLMLALRKAKRRLAFPVTEYFADIPQAREERKRKALFNPQEVLERIGDDARPLEARLWVAFLFIINCRPNEMFALKWSDIDLANETVTICKAVQRDKHRFKIAETTKTGRRRPRSASWHSACESAARREEATHGTG